MSRFKKLSHSIYECKYHIVFCLKYRYRIFDGQIGDYASQQVYQLARQKDLLAVEELNVQPDHAQILEEINAIYITDIDQFSKKLNLFI
ncbi:MAG: transposase, partial [Deltaproteobacteria bacterium]|nr:transposase [Deltaproteobacteria bacterium]